VHVEAHETALEWLRSTAYQSRARPLLRLNAADGSQNMTGVLRNHSW